MLEVLLVVHFGDPDGGMPSVPPRMQVHLGVSLVCHPSPRKPGVLGKYVVVVILLFPSFIAKNFFNSQQCDKKAKKVGPPPKAGAAHSGFTATSGLGHEAGKGAMKYFLLLP